MKLFNKIKAFFSDSNVAEPKNIEIGYVYYLPQSDKIVMFSTTNNGETFFYEDETIKLEDVKATNFDAWNVCTDAVYLGEL